MSLIQLVVNGLTNLHLNTITLILRIEVNMLVPHISFISQQRSAFLFIDNWFEG